MDIAVGFPRCLVSPAHFLMLAGHGIDRVLFVDGTLCLSVTSFDPELLRLAVASCPFMYGGMALGLAFGSWTDGARAFLMRLGLQLGAMFCAMVVAAHLWPDSSMAALAAMMAAMSLTGHVGRRIISAPFLAIVYVCMHRMENSAKRSV